MGRICVTLFLIIFSKIGYSQECDSVTLDFYNRIFKRYSNETLLEYKFTAIQYDSTRLGVINSVTGKVTQSLEKYEYEIDKVRVILQDSIYINVFNDKKEIYYHILDSIQKKKLVSFSPLEMIKKINSKIKIEKYDCNEPNLECYNLIFGVLNKDLYKIKLDLKSGLVSELEIDYYGSDEKQNIVNYFMIVKYFGYKEKSKKDYFPLNEFFNFERHPFVLNNKYSDYQLIKF
jgi:hypothetical protein